VIERLRVAPTKFSERFFGQDAECILGAMEQLGPVSLRGTLLDRVILVPSRER
jgi:hypothetical protein